MSLNRRSQVLCVGGGGLAVIVCKEGPETAAIHYLDSDHVPNIIMFPLDQWPPTDDDVKRAEVTVALKRR